MDLFPIEDQSDYLNILVYGRPDAGKTTFGCSGASHPEFSPTVVMNIEDGLQSVRHFGKGVRRTKKIETAEDIEAVILAAASKAGGFADCRCLVIDSLTKMADILLRRIAADGHAKKSRKGGAGQIERSDYNHLGNRMVRYVDLLNSLDMHIVLIALEKEVKDEVTEAVTDITVALPGVLAGKVIAATDMVFALTKIPPTEESGPSVGMITQQTGTRHARVRNKELREEIDLAILNPTLPMIWDIYQKSLATGRAKNEE
jgi:hypothetical protein